MTDTVTSAEPVTLSASLDTRAQARVDDRVHRRRWATLAVLCVSLLVIVIDNTIVNVALPTLVRDLGTSISDLQWVVDAYTLVFAGLLLTAGSLGDRFGRKGALTAGLVVFGAASAAAAFAGGVDSLIAARAVMGIGAALIMPATLSILTNVFTDARERALAIGLWSGVAGIAVALGPVTGGFLLEHFWWGSVFIVNVPIVIAAIVAGHFLVPTSRNPKRPRLDLVGAGLSIVGLGALVAAIIEAPSNGWTNPVIVAGFAIAAVALVAFVWWERRIDEPMLDVRFFANPRFTAASVNVTLVFFALFGFIFLATQYLQFVLGLQRIRGRHPHPPVRVRAHGDGADVVEGGAVVRHEARRRHRDAAVRVGPGGRVDVDRRLRVRDRDAGDGADGRGHGPVGRAGDRVDHGLAAPAPGRCGFGGQRHQP